MTSNSALSTQYSISPNGESFPLPKPEDYDKEFKRLQKLVVKHRKEGREIVVVMGVGFVGAVMAGIVADSVDKATGKPGKFVIGMQRPSPRSYWKIPLLNKGVAPVEAEDPEVAPKIALLGASYREDVGNTRYSGSEIVVRKLTEMGGEIATHDRRPYKGHLLSRRSGPHDQRLQSRPGW